MSAKLALFEIIVRYSEAEALEALSKLAGGSNGDIAPLQSQTMYATRNDAGEAKRAARAARIAAAGNKSLTIQN